MKYRNIVSIKSILIFRVICDDIEAHK